MNYDISSRKISFVCYDLDSSHLEQALKSLKACYIVHNADEGKETHVHGIILLPRSRRLADIKSLLSNSLEGNIFLEPIYDVHATFEYLTHRNSPDKHAYDEDSIVYFNSDKHVFITYEVKIDVLQFAVFDLINGASLSSCISTYGRDFIIHYSSIKYLLGDLGYIYNNQSKKFQIKGD